MHANKSGAPWKGDLHRRIRRRKSSSSGGEDQVGAAQEPALARSPGSRRLFPSPGNSPRNLAKVRAATGLERVGLADAFSSALERTPGRREDWRGRERDGRTRGRFGILRPAELGSAVSALRAGDPNCPEIYVGAAEFARTALAAVNEFLAII